MQHKVRLVTCSMWLKIESKLRGVSTHKIQPEMANISNKPTTVPVGTCLHKNQEQSTCESSSSTSSTMQQFSSHCSAKHVHAKWLRRSRGEQAFRWIWRWTSCTCGRTIGTPSCLVSSHHHGWIEMSSSNRMDNFHQHAYKWVWDTGPWEILTLVLTLSSCCKFKWIWDTLREFDPLTCKWL